METVSIRDLRGVTLRDRAREGKPLAITNHRVLIGVIIPVVPAWVEHLICYNWSHVRQSIAEGENALAGGTPITALPDVIAEAGAVGPGAGPVGPYTPAEPAIPLAAALIDQTVVQTPRSKETLARLQAALNPPDAVGRENGLAEHPVERVVRIGDLSADMIEKAGRNGQTLAVTHDRELIGIIIPVTQSLVQFLIEQSLNRVMHSIDIAEKQLGTPDEMITLDQAIPPGSARSGHDERPRG